MGYCMDIFSIINQIPTLLSLGAFSEKSQPVLNYKNRCHMVSENSLHSRTCQYRYRFNAVVGLLIKRGRQT